MLLVVEGVVGVSDMWLLLLVVVGKGKQLYSIVPGSQQGVACLYVGAMCVHDERLVTEGFD